MEVNPPHLFFRLHISMSPPYSIKTKIKNVLRLDRPIRLVWGASRKWTLSAVLLTLVNGFLPLASLYLFKLIIDTISRAVEKGGTDHDFRQLLFLITATTLVAIIQAAFRQAGLYVQEAQTTVVTDHVSKILHKKSISLDLSFYENPYYHDTLHRAQREGPYRPTRIVNALTQLTQNGISLVAMMALLFTCHWSLGILLVLSTLPGLVVQIFHAKKRYRWQTRRTASERRAQYFSSVMTHDSFAKEIRLFALGDFFIKGFDELRTLLRREKLQLSRSRGYWDFGAQIFAALVLMGSLLLVAHRALLGLITLGDLVMYSQALQRGISSLKSALQHLASLYEDNLFVSYFFEFLDLENHIRNPECPEKVHRHTTSAIRIEDLNFTYPGKKRPVLRSINIRIAPGEIVAVVGSNGAGKSTLVKLLCRLYDPDSGCIRINGNNIKNYILQEYRHGISVVFQDFAKYFLSVKENIALGNIRTQIDDKQISEAAQTADAHEFIDKLPHQYDTILGRWFNEGEELSQGQWQKIVLARAFLRQAPFIILDEPTSSMDVHTEYHLYKKFRELVKGRSALVISHRFSTVRMADRIYVMEQGEVKEEGSHAELLDRGGYYAKMYAKQAHWMTKEASPARKDADQR